MSNYPLEKREAFASRFFFGFKNMLYYMRLDWIRIIGLRGCLNSLFLTRDTTFLTIRTERSFRIKTRVMIFTDGIIFWRIRFGQA